jgi:Ulp1 protease family, C-terminal catalytic domain
MQHLGKTNPHWVAIVVDAKRGAIKYGDSFGNDMPFYLLEAYQWWLSQHSSTPFALEELPIATQTDSSSCGFLSNNSLEHYAFPESVPLIRNFDIAAVRMKTFLLIGNQILGSTVSRYIY